MLPRLRALFRRREVTEELDEELNYHLDREIERNITSGMTPAEARAAAHRAFGNLTHHAEDAHGAWQTRWLEVLIQDLRYGIRALSRAPTFTLVAALSLGLGIGANTTIFGLIYHVLFQPLPLPHPEQLAVVTRIGTDGPDHSFRLQQARILAAQSGFSSATIEWDVDNMPVATGDVRHYTNLLLIDSAYYRTLGLSPYRGRLISALDVTRGAPVAVMSVALARQLFGSEDSALGKIVSIHDQRFTVVGVTPPSYRGLEYPGHFQLAVPVTLAPLVGLPDRETAANTWVELIGRVSNGSARARVEGQLNAVFQQCCVGQAVERLALGSMVRGIGGGKDDMRSDVSPMLYALLGCVILVLLIACANVGNLLLLRSTVRQREIAVRLSLGASRARIARQLLTESALLAAAGAALGLVLAAWTTGLLVRAMPSIGDGYAEIVRFHVSLPIVAFVALIAAGSLFVFGVAPAFAASRADLASSMKSGAPATAGRSSGGAIRWLVAVQVALALTLVSTASLLVATLTNLASRDVGIRTSGMIGMGVETRGTSYEAQGVVPLWPDILRAVQGVPGVAGAGMATLVPLFGGRMATVQLLHQDGSPDGEEVPLTGVSASYFTATGIALIAGRSFGDEDRTTAEPVTILSESLARRLGGLAAVGTVVHLSGRLDGARRVVGIVRDVRLGSPRDPPSASIYFPLDQIGRWPYVQLMIRRTPGAPVAADSIIRVIERTAPGIRVRNVLTVEEERAAWLLRELVAAGLASVFSVVALGLAAIGLYGVIAYQVARRTSEIGVRMALGASRGSVVSLVTRRSFALVGGGIIVAIPLVFAAGRAVRSLLFGVGSTDGGALAASLLILVAVSLVATLIPAVRAARIDPLVALRQD